MVGAETDQSPTMQVLPVLVLKMGLSRDIRVEGVTVVFDDLNT